mmetsp:Transcript_55225/g.131179  ORF Transcript_55225/g.131179 Transcript_55225/m.131179 type:complete len:237 (-) Transcript_55225:3616-4326(-)
MRSCSGASRGSRRRTLPGTARTWSCPPLNLRGRTRAAAFRPRTHPRTRNASYPCRSTPRGTARTPYQHAPPSSSPRARSPRRGTPPCTAAGGPPRRRSAPGGTRSTRMCRRLTLRCRGCRGSSRVGRRTGMRAFAPLCRSALRGTHRTSWCPPGIRSDTTPRARTQARTSLCTPPPAPPRRRSPPGTARTSSSPAGTRKGTRPVAGIPRRRSSYTGLLRAPRRQGRTSPLGSARRW